VQATASIVRLREDNAIGSLDAFQFLDELDLIVKAPAECGFFRMATRDSTYS
jgi:hypothetical protein